jgi:hypothetical protein
VPVAAENRLVTRNPKKQRGAAAEVKANFIRRYGLKRGTAFYYGWLQNRSKAQTGHALRRSR